MNVLDLLRNKGIEPKKAASSKGGEWWSPCPGCGGDDRFHVWPEQNSGEGSWWCRMCGKSGDAIQFLIDFEGMKFPEACRALNKEIPSRDRLRPPMLPGGKKTAWKPTEYLPPAELWRKKAEKFIDRCHEMLLSRSEQLAWLERRGIGLEAVKEFKVGVNPADYFWARESWGLETVFKEGGKKKKLWIPRGIVIPYIVEGAAIRIRVRRPKVDLKGERSQKYYVVPGSGMAPILIRPVARAFVVIEAELDAIATAAAVPAYIGAMATGSSSARPDTAAVAVLKKSDCILVALDFDAAGAKAWQWWQRQFSQAERWPVPDGKDPGDAVKSGVDLYAWVYAGLPPSMTVGRSFLDSEKKEAADILKETVAVEAAPAPGLNNEHRCNICGWYGEHYEFCPEK